MADQFRRIDVAGKQVRYRHTRTMVDSDPDTSYLYQDEFADRREAFERGDFDYIGIDAVAIIIVGGVQQTISSGGLWGIESDARGEHLAELRREQLDELSDILRELGFTQTDIDAARGESNA